MKQIDKISKSPSQQYSLTTEDGNTVVLRLKYLPSQQQWMFGLQWSDWTLNGAILSCGPNILRGYKNNIPFGIAVVSNDGLDPLYLNDFTSGRVKLYLLNKADVLAVEKALFK